MAFMDTVKKWFGSAKEGASELAEKAEPMLEKTKDFASDAMAKAEPMFEKTKEAAAKAADAVGEKVSEMTGKGEAAEPVIDKTDTASGVVDETNKIADDATDGSDD